MNFLQKIMSWFARLKRQRSSDIDDFFWEMMQTPEIREEFFKPNERPIVLQKIYELMEITAINDDLIARGWTLEAARNHIKDLPLFKLKDIHERMLKIADSQRKLDMAIELIKRAKQIERAKQERKRLHGKEDS